MIRRYLQDLVLTSLKHFPVVLLTGARQVGKSTHGCPGCRLPAGVGPRQLLEMMK